MKFNIRFDFTSDFVCSRFSFQKGYCCFVEDRHDYFLFNCLDVSVSLNKNLFLNALLIYEPMFPVKFLLNAKCDTGFTVFFKVVILIHLLIFFGRYEPKFALKFFHCEYTKGNSRQQPISKAGKILCCQFILLLFGGLSHFYCDIVF